MKNNWDYFVKKYNLSLDNENYEDLENALEEAYDEGFAVGYEIGETEAQ